MASVAGKSILFFAPNFFRYEYIIADKMREMGAMVDVYDEKSVAKAIHRALLKISADIFKKRSLLYYEQILQECFEKEYDYILIIKCDMTPISIIKKIKARYPKAKLILYLYDSIKNVHGIKKKMPLFDAVYSFDSEDCKKNPQMNFRPLFYNDNFCMPLKKKAEYLYDVGFFGTIHADRYAIIKQVQAICKERRMKIWLFCYLQSEFIYYFYKLTKKEFWGAHKKDFSFEKLSGSQIASLANKTRIIFDAQNPRQTGLTMRTIEMVGMNKKLITTNTAIRDYDFYNPNNICIIDRKHVEIPERFLETPYEPLAQDVYEKYSLKNWILEVLS